MKQEHETNLNKTEFVRKDHPCIRFRGGIDSLHAKFLLIICTLPEGSVKDALCEMLLLIEYISRAEATREPFSEIKIMGKTLDELHKMSQNPQKYFGVKHFYAAPRMGGVVAKLNYLRVCTRELECLACSALDLETQKDILRALNRMSSAVYVLMCMIVADNGGISWT